MKEFRFELYIIVTMALAILPAGCIHNDLPYPRIAQNILSIAAEGESKAAYIDALAFEVDVYLEETVDIRNVRFSDYKITDGAISNPNLLEGSYDMTTPLYVTLTRYQDYDWKLIAHQDIERYFQVEGELGKSVVDPIGRRVIVNMPEGTDLSRLVLQRVKLGPEGITTITPELAPGPLDLSYPLRVAVSCHGRTEYWTIYAQLSETIVSTLSVDAWSKVIWAYGNGPADVKNGFEYKKANASEWTKVPEQYVTQTQGSFFCYIPHLEPLSDYVVRAVSGENIANEVAVSTQGTADIPNGDFEDWCQIGKIVYPYAEGGVQFWDTGNTGSSTLGQNLTTSSTDTPTGSGLSAECRTEFVGIAGIGKLGAGSIFTGKFVKVDGTNGILDFGRPWNLRPTKLKGYYKYKTSEINYVSSEFSTMKGEPDTCVIYVALTDWTAPYEIRTNPKNRNLFDPNASYVIGYGQMQYSGTMDSWSEFEIPITYRDTSKEPTYIQITAATSKYGDYFTGAAGAVLWVDQFSFGWDLE